MKRHILSIIAVLLFTATSFASRSRQELIIEAEFNMPIIVHVDGVCINSEPRQQIVIDDLYSGKHHIKVEVFGHRGSTVIRDNIDLLPNHLTVYAVERHGRGDFCLELAECTPLIQGCGIERGNRYGNRQIRGRTLQGHRYGQGSRGQVNNNRYGISNRRVTSRVSQHRGSNVDIGRLIQVLDNTPFDRDRLEIAKSAISGSRGISSRDVLRISEEFVFDRSRLEFAKFAFNHTYDKQNYFIVNDAFVFSSSKRELSRFIRTA